MRQRGAQTGLDRRVQLQHTSGGGDGTHAQAAHDAGAALYAAGALISQKGYGPESAMLQGYARNHDMAVLLANYSGETGGYVSAGKSAFWAPGGRCVVAAQGDAPCMVWAARGDSPGLRRPCRRAARR